MASPLGDPPVSAASAPSGASFRGLKNCANILYVFRAKHAFCASRINGLVPEKTGCEGFRPSQFCANKVNYLALKKSAANPDFVTDFSKLQVEILAVA
jgi:hypothetical protein